MKVAKKELDHIFFQCSLKVTNWNMMSNFKLIPLESASTKGENTVLHTSSRILGFMQIKALQKL